MAWYLNHIFRFDWCTNVLLVQMKFNECYVIRVPKIVSLLSSQMTSTTEMIEHVESRCSQFSIFLYRPSFPIYFFFHSLPNRFHETNSFAWNIKLDVYGENASTSSLAASFFFLYLVWLCFIYSMNIIMKWIVGIELILKIAHILMVRAVRKCFANGFYVLNFVVVFFRFFFLV